MAIIVGSLLVLLGLAAGFILAWAFRVGASASLAVGVLLVIAGAVVGFIVEWLIDEAYRKNRELQRQLGELARAPLPASGGGDGRDASTALDPLSRFLEQREGELREIRQQLAAATTKLDSLEDEFGTYQRTHPDDLTVIRGIGPVFQWKLRDCGFNTYKQLAVADPVQLRRMLGVKNWQRVDVGSWIQQAQDWARRA
jgi:predicted flap endonuclease-1-like 5' DNA nuclease